jgi:hypothetical protein
MVTEISDVLNRTDSIIESKPTAESKTKAEDANQVKSEQTTLEAVNNTTSVGNLAQEPVNKPNADPKADQQL